MHEVTAKIAPIPTGTQERAASRHCWKLRSIAILVFAWLLLQFGGIFSPGLLDDVDSIYIEIAREMLHRHDFVTPYINGIRFFDKPPLMYWMAAGSMHLFGETDWAARIPLILSVLALLLAVYALGIRLFREISPVQSPDRGGLYAALIVATSIGPYLFTRFYIPDILLCLWMTLGVHLTLIALDRIHQNSIPLKTPRSASRFPRSYQPLSSSSPLRPAASALLPCLAFAAVLALNVLTKGLIGLVFPIAFVFLYLAFTKQLHLLPKLHLLPSTAVFLAIAAPWHILAALRTPAISLPAGLGLPATGGWTWFYLYNEHIARFLAKRIPHDYGQVPIPLFWLMLLVWVMPWSTFIPGALTRHIRALRNRAITTAQDYEAALALLLWTGIVMGFFTLSSRQEYYSLPAIPALALMAGGLLTRAESNGSEPAAQRSALRWSTWFLLPITTLIAVVCGYFSLTAPRLVPGPDGRIPDLADLLSNNPSLYNLSLGHLYDLTGDAMGLFRGPLTAVALSMIAVGPIALLLRRRGSAFAANLTLAAGMTVTLLAAHEGLIRFNPILGSKGLALSIDQAQQSTPTPPGKPQDLIVLDGELTSGSTLIFYTRQQLHLIDGRVNGLWYGSFWPDAPAIFETENSLHQLWSSPRRIFLFTYNSTSRKHDLAPYGAVRTLSTAGGKSILTNR
ncbi:glycosyltransferase family 39 protein [Granulicella sp. dw_53]|uniref:ArnT family glycosyltransferase n=1 Tax=Granulicella sp. dw_53 TaxID=2719792 RepID=UPI001C4A4045|nr:glycosyltransferase family 39 protein [Granulicella sp. dw_53]